MDHDGLALSVLLSTPVERNLRELGVDLIAFEHSETRDFYGISAMWKGMDSYFTDYDLVFTVFGPSYFFHKNTRHLFGFAQPNIVYPHNHLTARMRLLRRLITRAKYEIQAWFFSRADEIVVELEHVKLGLRRRAFFEQKPISVVYNSVHSVFREPHRWVSLDMPSQPRGLRLGVISRNYPHKNLAILADVKQHLLKTHGLEVNIFVTFTQREWDNCDEYFRRNIINVGALSLSQCPTFYKAMHGVVFPSLLECFSAVPIETMIMGRPLFASNLPFIKDVCGEHCVYFEPLDPVDIANTIGCFYSLPISEQQRLCEEARVHVLRFPDAQQRATQYLTVIKNALS